MGGARNKVWSFILDETTPFTWTPRRELANKLGMSLTSLALEIKWNVPRGYIKEEWKKIDGRWDKYFKKVATI